MGFIVTEFVYGLKPDLNPGKITALRTEMYHNQFLAAVSIRLGLPRFLSHMSVPLAKVIQDWIAKFYPVYQETEQLIQSGEYEKEPETLLFWNYLPSAPKTLGDIYESLVGAVFLDSGFDINVIRDLVHKTLISPWWSRFEQLMQGSDGLRIDQPIRCFTDLIFELKCTQSVFHADILDNGCYQVKITFHDIELSNYVAETKREAKKVASIQAYEYFMKNHADLTATCPCKDQFQTNTLQSTTNQSDDEE